MRETTLEAYLKIKQSGLLSDLRWRVFECLCNHEDSTANELRMFMDPTANSGVFSTRLSELERLGYVYVSGKRPCTTTKHNAVTWAITGFTIPIAYEKQRTRKEIKTEACDRLCNLHSEMTDMFHKEELFQIIQFIHKNL